MELRSYLDTAPRGTAAAIAKSVDVSPVMVTQWANGEKPVPAVRCPLIEFATAGQVTAEELCDEVVWIRVSDPDWPNPFGRPCIDIAAPVLIEATAGQGG